MKFRIPAEAGLVIVAGAALALSGCTPAQLALAGFSPPVQLFSPPVGGSSLPIGHLSPPIGSFSPPVGLHSGPVASASGPRCVDIRTPRVTVTVGSASPPALCTTITTGGVAPVGDASAPRCVSITTPRSTLRRC